MLKITGDFTKFAYFPRNFSSRIIFQPPFMLRITGIFAEFAYLPRNFSLWIIFQSSFILKITGIFTILFLCHVITLVGAI